MHRKTVANKFPSVITMFSAPNNLNEYHNCHSVIKYKSKSIAIWYVSSDQPALPSSFAAFKCCGQAVQCDAVPSLAAELHGRVHVVAPVRQC